VAKEASDETSKSAQAYASCNYILGRKAPANKKIPELARVSLVLLPGNVNLRDIELLIS
jgi:hypothetical protein